MIKKRWKPAVIAVCVLAAGICYMLSRSGAGDGGRTIFMAEECVSAGQADTAAAAFEALPPELGAEETAFLSGGPETGSEEALEGSPAKERRVLWVHVCGEVKDPGVYELDDGSRIYQAVERAGGFTEKAQPDFLNMAQPLEDGMKLIVPDQETAARLLEAGDASAAGEYGSVPGGAEAGIVRSGGDGSGSGKSPGVNINSATREELMTLKGIGEARAEDIIAYRQEHGPFQKIEDIMKVSGIKEAAFQKIREDITV